MVSDGEGQELQTLTDGGICLTATGKVVRARTVGQKRYVTAMQKHTVAMAVKAFKQHTVSRIILTRPAVEAGEKLGFLPGDLQNKVDPYLRPLYDALFEMMGAEAFQRNLERGLIEVAPLAYMRGRTLDHAYIILVITGDITQIDLPDKRKCGLLEAMQVLRNVEGIAMQEFTNKDVVRHRLVQDIIRAYEKYYHRDRKVEK